MTTSALVVLRPWESKRLIGKAVAQLPQVKKAMEQGYILIAGGTTNGFVAEELTGRKIDKANYTIGKIDGGELTNNSVETAVKPIVLKDGQPIKATFPEVLPKLGARDVFIKGANAIDTDGVAGILVSSPTGGTIGQAWGRLVAAGVNLIIPVGLEKLVPSVTLAASYCGQDRFAYSTGRTCGLAPVTGGLIITELEALDILFDVDAVHVASGGLGDSQGSVVISFSGEEEKVKAAFDFIKGEIKE
ncbi:MAG: hypothetical protein H0Z38_07145 [Firmicutes bacterium]|nr:hypothetical protein [Bacillota bacterium]